MLSLGAKWLKSQIPRTQYRQFFNVLTILNTCLLNLLKNTSKRDLKIVNYDTVRDDQLTGLVNPCTYSKLFII